MACVGQTTCSSSRFPPIVLLLLPESETLTLDRQALQKKTTFIQRLGGCVSGQRGAGPNCSELRALKHGKPGYVPPRLRGGQGLGGGGEGSGGGGGRVVTTMLL